METNKHRIESGGNSFWEKAFFSGYPPARLRGRAKKKPEKTRRKVGEAGAWWLTQLFSGAEPDPREGDKMRILQAGVVVYETPLQKLPGVTVIGRHPEADLQLEADKMAPFHAVILNHGGKFYLQSLDDASGARVNRKKLPLKQRFPLYDGLQIDLPGYRLEFSMAGSPRPAHSIFDDLEADAEDKVPDFFYQAPPLPASPSLASLIESKGFSSIWKGGAIRLKVVDIIDETPDCKTFCLAGVQPVLFAYKPGQFMTFTLEIAGKKVSRCYSLSSAPSRPFSLEITIKRVPGGLVSNWFCDHVEVGGELVAEGPKGDFTCFGMASPKILFIAAGSGITPILSMCRWLADTAAEVDVKLLASFKSPEQIIFRKELEMLSARCRRIRIAVTMTSSGEGADSWTGFAGRVSPQMLAAFAPDICEREVFLCGPDAFMQNVSGMLRDLGYDMSRCHTESFCPDRPIRSCAGNSRPLRLTEPLYKVKFTRSGKIVDTDQRVTLLELAEAHGIEVDYSCRAGSCGECAMKCRGEVHIDPACEIDEKTRKAGFVYSCCTTARSDLDLDI